MITRQHQTDRQRAASGDA